MTEKRRLNQRELEERERDLERREMALRAQTAQHDLIAELGSFFAFVIDLDADGRVAGSWSPGNSRPIGGLTLEHARSADWQRHILPEDRRVAWDLLTKALSTGEASGEYRITGLQGETHWLNSSVRRIEDARGQTKLLGIVQDITDLRRTEQALHASELSFENLFRSAPVVMMISAVDDGTLVDVNKLFSEATGYAREEAIGKTATELGLWRSAQQRDDFREIRRENSGIFEGIEALVRTKSGEMMVALLSAQRVNLEGRECAIWHAVDITRRKEVETELARYREDLEVLVEERTTELEVSREQLRHTERLASIGTLAAGIAHQINNPIGVIMAASQHALDCENDADATEVWRTALEEAESHSQRCARIVRSVLQFARDEKTEKWEDDLTTALRRACNLTRSYADECGAELVFETPESRIPVEMNPIEMEQVLVNVLRNALESKTEGAHVTASIQRSGEQAVIVVEDDGRGVAPEVMSQIFDPFFTTRLSEGGTGLGLSVAHGIVTDHGGRMSIDSREEEGCRVRIELPLASAKD